jgi:hypothetical protein
MIGCRQNPFPAAVFETIFLDRFSELSPKLTLRYS